MRWICFKCKLKCFLYELGLVGIALFKGLLHFLRAFFVNIARFQKK